MEVVKDIIDHIQSEVVDSNPDDYEEEFQWFQRITMGPRDDGPQNARKDAGEDKMETKGAYPDLPVGKRL
jgi:hypothetical protein